MQKTRPLGPAINALPNRPVKEIHDHTLWILQSTAIRNLPSRISVLGSENALDVGLAIFSIPQSPLVDDHAPVPQVFEIIVGTFPPGKTCHFDPSPHLLSVPILVDDGIESQDLKFPAVINEGDHITDKRCFRRATRVRPQSESIIEDDASAVLIFVVKIVDGSIGKFMVSS